MCFPAAQFFLRTVKMYGLRLVKWSIGLILVVWVGLALAACGGRAPTPALSDATQEAPALETAPPGPAIQIASPAPVEIPGGATRTAAPDTQLQSHNPAPSLTPTPLACWSQPGRMELGSLPTDLLRLPLEYRVYLPPCYDEPPERRYPVLYMIHGQSYNDDQWDRLGIDEAASRLIAAGELPPFLIVLPRDRHWGQPSEDLFGQAVREVLIPFIDQEYRTRPERDYRAVGGLSRGAGWAVHLGIFFPELFGALGAHSLPVFHEDTARLRTYLDTVSAGDLPRIYLDIGEKDRPEILRSAVWFEQLLTDKGIPHEWYLFSGYHEEAYWQAHLETYLRWYAQDWQD